MPELLLRQRVRRRIPTAQLRYVCTSLQRRYLDGRPLTVELDVVGAARMRTLNRAWRGCDRPTDVLSMERAVPPVGPVLLGPIALCPDVAARAERAHEQSLPYLFAHGLLHCIGWDHATETTGHAMDTATRSLLPKTVSDALQREEIIARR